jgi:hypothetical protein
MDYIVEHDCGSILSVISLFDLKQEENKLLSFTEKIFLVDDSFGKLRVVVSESIKSYHQVLTEVLSFELLEEL